MIFGRLLSDEVETLNRWIEDALRQDERARNFIFPRSQDEYAQLIEDDNLWCVRQPDNCLVGMGYYFRDELGSWEIGGLYIAESCRRSGIGQHLFWIMLAHLVYTQITNTLEQRILVRIHSKNYEFEEALTSFGFAKLDEIVELDSTSLPEMMSDEDGLVRGFQYELMPEQGLASLIACIDSWQSNRPTGWEINMPPNASTDLWRQVVADLLQQARGLNNDQD